MPGHPQVQSKPGIELGQLRVPGERTVVRVADGHDPARLGDPAHLPQRLDRIGDVLQHLVRVHHVEGAVRVGQRVHVSGLEPDVRRCTRAGQRQHLRQWLDRRHLAHPPGQVRGDRRRPAPDIKQRHARVEVPEQVSGRVLRRPPAVRPQYRLMMPVCIRRHAVHSTDYLGQRTLKSQHPDYAVNAGLPRPDESGNHPHRTGWLPHSSGARGRLVPGLRAYEAYVEAGRGQGWARAGLRAGRLRGGRAEGRAGAGARRGWARAGLGRAGREGLGLGVDAFAGGVVVAVDLAAA
jgi:hypothetical protein